MHFVECFSQVCKAFRCIRDLRLRCAGSSPSPKDKNKVACTMFSKLNENLNFHKMDPEKLAQLLDQARVHLRFVVSLYALKLKEGRHFLHEHPAGASSWSDPWIQTLHSHPLC